MMNSLQKILGNQRGSVINIALLFLILIFLIGIGLHKTSTTDIKISSNMKTDTTTFYEAEGGLDAAAELLELNIPCTIGFTDNTEPGVPSGWENIEGMIMVTNLAMWRNDAVGDPTGNPDPDFPILFPGIDAFYPPDYDGSDNPDAPHTNLSVGGTTRFSRGSAIQMAAGYEGLGKGSAGGGATIIYDVMVMRYGENNSEARHMIQWVHKLGLGGVTCQY